MDPAALPWCYPGWSNAPASPTQTDAPACPSQAVPIAHLPCTSLPCPSAAGARQSDGAMEQRAGLGGPCQRKKGCVQTALTPYKHTGTSILLTSGLSDPTCPRQKHPMHHALAVFSVRRRGESGGLDCMSLRQHQLWERQSQIPTPPGQAAAPVSLSRRDGPRPSPKQPSMVPTAASPTGCQGGNGGSESCGSQ